MRINSLRKKKKSLKNAKVKFWKLDRQRLITNTFPGELQNGALRV